MILTRAFCALALFIVCISPSRAQDESLDGLLRQLGVEGISVIYSTDLVRGDIQLVEQVVDNSNFQRLQLSLLPYGLDLLLVGAQTWVITSQQRSVDVTAGSVIVVRLRDAATDRPLANASVQLEGVSTTQIADRQGIVLFPGVPAGEYVLTVNAAGYARLVDDSILAESGQPVLLEKSLVPLPVALDKMVISASRYALSWGATQQEGFQLDQEQLLNAPSLGDDPVRAVHALPGVGSNGLSAKLHVRGGAENENLLFLDGLELHNPFHLKDFFSVFSIINADLVDRVEVYTGVFPVDKAGKMSSVMDFRTITPDAPLDLDIGIGLLNNYLVSGGEFNQQKGHWLVAGRRGGLDLVADLLDEEHGRPRYYDTFARLSHQLGDTSTVSATWLLARDEIRINDDPFEDAEAKSLDRYFWFSLDQDISDNVTATSLLFQNTQKNSRNGTVNWPNAIAGQLDEDIRAEVFGVKTDWRWHFNDRTGLRFGASYGRHKARYFYQLESQILGPLGDINGIHRPVDHVFSTSIRGDEYRAYTALQFTAGKNISGELGAQWAHQQWLDDSQASLSTQWRYTYSDDLIFRFAWGRFYQVQNIGELDLEPELPAFYAPEYVNTMVLGLDKQFSSGINLRFELFNKHYDNPAPYYENLFDKVAVLPELQYDRTSVRPLSGNARGAEVSLSGARSGLEWSMSYSLSRATEQTDSAEYSNSWDQRHSLKSQLSWHPGQWLINLNAEYHSGWPTSGLTLDADNTLQVGSRNRLHFNNNKRVDIKFTRPFAKRWQFWFELSNALNFDNVCCTEYQLDDSGTQSLLIGNEDTWLPIVPSLGVEWHYR